MAQLSVPFPSSRTITERVIPKPNRNAIGRVSLGLILPIAILVGWQLVTNAGIYTRGQLPAPIDVWRAGAQLAARDELLIQVQVSFDRVLRGFALGSAAALLLGLVVGLSPLASRVFDPTVQAIRAIPSLAYVPLFVLWMGIGEQPKITLIAVGAFFPVYANLVSGIRQIDPKLIEAASAYGYRRFSLAREVTLPATLPSLMTGLRIGLAQAWLFLVAAELIGASQGLGFLLIDGQNTGRADIIVLSIVMLAMIGLMTDLVLQFSQRRLMRWSEIDPA